MISLYVYKFIRLNYKKSYKNENPDKSKNSKINITIDIKIKLI